MNMDPVPHADLITQVTDSLVQNFVKPLYDSCNEKNYFAYVRCLSSRLLIGHMNSMFIIPIK